MLQKCCLLLLTTLMLLITIEARRRVSYKEENGVKEAVYLSPRFSLSAGSVIVKYYQNVDFPRGHIAIKEFNAEVVDTAGNPVPLHETYVHHWVMARYYTLLGGKKGREEMKIILVRNSGTCEDNTLAQYFGLGSETRKTHTHIPEPYGIQVGNPADIPDGYKERWVLNVHAIDTRGVVDRMGCAECRCDLYNVTSEEVGDAYIGGLSCCVDGGQCRLKEGFKSVTRKFYMRYTVKWIDWVDTVLPVKIYILDATDDGNKTARADEVGCKIEYDVISSGVSCGSGNGCVDSKKANIVMPRGGNVIYGVGHQHAGAIGSSLYGQDGRVICSSMAIHGEGNEAGNEAGYVVGMTTCYPTPGSVKIYDGETVTVEMNYNNSQTHTGVMGLFYLLIADQVSNTTLAYL